MQPFKNLIGFQSLELVSGDEHSASRFEQQTRALEKNPPHLIPEK